MAEPSEKCTWTKMTDEELITIARRWYRNEMYIDILEFGLRQVQEFYKEASKLNILVMGAN